MPEEPVPDVSPELPAFHWRATLGLLRRLPQGALSRAFGRVADLPIPPRLRPAVLGAFARGTGIDIDEAELPLVEYPTINRFFVRRLRPGARAWPAASGVAASPVDGVVGQSGRIRSGTLLQAKGRTYTVHDLLADADDARRYDDGSFLTLYLSPRHYHRIHAPCSGAIGRARYVPGALLPVNAPAVMHVDRLFPRNERLLCTIDGSLGRVVVVAVGAYNVGRISAAFDPAWNGGEHGWVTNRGRRAIEERHYDPAVRVERGDEIMAFHLGSTIVLLFERSVRLEPRAAGDAIALGSPIAQVSTP
ncbi:MAG TPA: archaetidylserine decarboxylase [Longimicrobiales bacterium]|nr:archaetidylserine decarboxylase [Longimicrobiales bacterium]